MSDECSRRSTELIHLHIPLADPEIRFECVWAESMGGDLYRLANVPFFADEVGIHDVVLALEVDEGLELVEVVERRAVASFNYELADHVDEPVFFAHARAMAAATERLGRACFTTNLHHTESADEFEALLRPQCHWFERFDQLGRLVREFDDVAV